jgi:hypothetical protein
MVRLRRSAVLALVASFVAAGLWADAQGRLQATVVDENGNPVADATVTITSPSPATRSATTGTSPPTRRAVSR